MLIQPADRSITINLPGNVRLQIPPAVAPLLIRELQDQLAEAPAKGSVGGRVFPDDHPVWERSSRARLGSPDWEADRDDEAEAVYLATASMAKTRAFLDLLIDHPGQQLTTDEMCELSPSAFANHRVIAGCLKGLYKSAEATGLRYPFWFWESKGAPSRYGMKPSVAAMFARARASVGGPA